MQRQYFLFSGRVARTIDLKANLMVPRIRAEVFAARLDSSVFHESPVTNHESRAMEQDPRHAVTFCGRLFDLQLKTYN